MRLNAITATALAAVVCAGMATAIPVQAQMPDKAQQIKTRLDHFAGTNWVLVVSYLPSEITSITCEKWTMLGVKSYKDQNNFTIPTGPAVAVMDANKFDGYCVKAGSIIAHTDDGDFPGVLDRGDGNWKDSTKLVFGYLKGQR